MFWSVSPFPLTPFQHLPQLGFMNDSLRTEFLALCASVYSEVPRNEPTLDLPVCRDIYAQVLGPRSCLAYLLGTLRPKRVPKARTYGFFVFPTVQGLGFLKVILDFGRLGSFTGHDPNSSRLTHNS